MPLTSVVMGLLDKRLPEIFWTYVSPLSNPVPFAFSDGTNYPLKFIGGTDVHKRYDRIIPKSIEFTEELFTPMEVDVNYNYNNSNLSNKFSKTFSDIATSWGRTENDIHIINSQMDAGTEGKDGYYNTYHYEKRYIFHMIGDVEFVSGSVSSSSASYDTDYYGTVGINGIHNRSKDISNHTFIQSDTGLGLRPLGTTIEFKPSSSIASVKTAEFAVGSNSIFRGGITSQYFLRQPLFDFLYGSSSMLLSRNNNTIILSFRV